MKKLDLANKRFGRILVIGKAYSKQRSLYWHVRCVCGNDSVCRGNNIKAMKVTTCKYCRRTKHGMWGTSIYRAWINMKQRCYNPRRKEYPNYGGRGIKICNRWLESFENFYNDMGDKPHQNSSLDRVNNDGNYEPSNCEWADRAHQNKNRRNVRSQEVKIKKLESEISRLTELLLDGG